MYEETACPIGCSRNHQFMPMMYRVMKCLVLEMDFIRGERITFSGHLVARSMLL